MSMQEPDELATLITTRHAFEAHVIVAVLQDAGIYARAFDAVESSLPLGSSFTRVPVQVRRVDLDRAKETLKSNLSDSIDLDWDQVDVGERADRVPLTTRRGMPLAAKVATAFAAALAVIYLMLTLLGIVRWRW
ncbi:MAG: putative signal transducing protein [Planctomycetota bacterium]|jgi:hypothetical protein